MNILLFCHESGPPRPPAVADVRLAYHQLRCTPTVGCAVATFCLPLLTPRAPQATLSACGWTASLPPPPFSSVPPCRFVLFDVLKADKLYAARGQPHVDRELITALLGECAKFSEAS